MAEHLTRVFGTEEDRVNCPFFFKMGACRHGDRCSRLHHKPLFSQTLLFPHMYQNPRVILTTVGQMPHQLDMRKVQEDFEDFYEEVFEELATFGEVEAMNVCDNLGDHLVGNVYVKFADEEAAAAALQKMNGRFYAGRMLTAEFSPVSDFREARCRQFDDGMCKRGDQCNFMHLMRVPQSLRRDLFEKQPHRTRGKRYEEEEYQRGRGGRGGGYGGRGGGYGGRGGAGGRDDRRRDYRDDRHRDRRDDRDRHRRDDRDRHRRDDRDRHRSSRSSRDRRDDRGDRKDSKRSRSRSHSRRRRSKSRSRSPARRHKSESRSRSRHRSNSPAHAAPSANAGAGAGAGAAGAPAAN